MPGATDREVSDFLETLGIRPGVRIAVCEHHPFGGPVVITVAGEDRTIGNSLARQIFIRVDERPRQKSRNPLFVGANVGVRIA